jgi:hypothetical protein
LLFSAAVAALLKTAAAVRSLIGGRVAAVAAVDCHTKTTSL